MVSANCGVPATVAASLKVTVASISSPATKTPPAPCPVPESETPVTTGPVASAPPPATTKSSSSPRAWVPRSSAAGLFAASRIVPEFRVSAEAATETPFASVSPETTV